MANHSIDCDFCGRDQRCVGTDCCKENIEFKKEREKTAEAEKKKWINLLKPYWPGAVHASFREVYTDKIMGAFETVSARMNHLEDTLNQIYHYTDCTQAQIELIDSVGCGNSNKNAEKQK